MRQTLLTIVLFLCFAVLPPVQLRADWRHSLVDDPQRGVSIELESAFEHIPKSGMWPVSVNIRNTSGRARSWLFTARINNSWSDDGEQWSYTSSRYLGVENGHYERFDILVPLPPNACKRMPSATYFSCNTYVYIDMSGIVGGSVMVTTNDIQSNLDFGAYTVFTSSVVPKEGALSDELKSRSLSFAGAQISNVELLPHDWRAYSGVASLWIAHADWSRMRPEARDAIGDWLLSGGKLYVSGPHSTQSTLPGLVGERSPSSQVAVGLGAVSFVESAKGEVDPSEMGAAIELGTVKAPAYQILNTEQPRSQNFLLAMIENSPLAVSAILFVMFMYAIVVGPINLLVIARKEHRFRLYVSTPIIAIATSAILVSFILFQDGTGGKGHRVSMVYLQPKRARAAIFQEQASGTGLLLKGQFQLPHEALLAPMAAKDHPTAYYYEQNEGNFFEDSASGDWFASRSKQAQYLSAVLPSRARLELVSNEPMQLQSSLPVMLETIYYRDSGGTVWRGENLGPGEQVQLRAVPDGTLIDTLNEFLKHAGASHHEIIEALSSEKNFAFAFTSKKSRDFQIDTLPGISWESDKIVVLTAIESQAGSGI